MESGSRDPTGWEIVIAPLSFRALFMLVPQTDKACYPLQPKLGCWSSTSFFFFILKGHDLTVDTCVPLVLSYVD